MITEKSPTKILRIFLTGGAYAPYAPCMSTPVGFNAGQTHISRSMYPSNLQPFTSYSEIGYWSEIATFSYPLAFNAPVGVIPLDNIRDFWWVSCGMARLHKYIWCKNIPERLNPLNRVRVHARHSDDRQTDDRQTDLPCH